MPNPTPTATPVPTVDPRFGVILHDRTEEGAAYFLEQLGVKWYLDFTRNLSNIPDGYNKLPYISVSSPTGLLSPADINSMVQAAPPGTYWYVGGEPNRQPSLTGTAFADVFHHYYTHIKAADPTAKVMSPSLLNWWFTCIGCGGFQKGIDWVDDFRSTYKSKYDGAEPPVDVWNIDLYPIDWNTVPNANWQLVRDQIIGGVDPTTGEHQQGMREYLDAIPDYQDTPIWITEMAVHWGYEGWQAVSDPEYGWLPGPTGSYRWDALSNYLTNMTDWLKADATSLRIERWFLYLTYTDIVTPNQYGYAGIILFDVPETDASLNCLGDIYRNRSLGTQPLLACNEYGETVTQ